MPDIPEIHRGEPDIGAVLGDKSVLIVALRRMEDGIVNDHIAGTAEYDCVLIVDPSRLSRSTEGCTLIGQKLNRHGIRVYTPQGKIQLPPPHAFFYSRYHKEGENDFGPGK